MPHSKAQTVGVIFKLPTTHYHLSHSYGELHLRQVSNSQIHDKAELITKDEVTLWHYIAQANNTTTAEARRAYDEAIQTI